MSNVSNIVSIISGIRAYADQLEVIAASLNTPVPQTPVNAPLAPVPSAPEKKQRGRPKKVIQVPASPVPAQPNFNVDSDAPSTPDAHSEKRGRGRPKGSPNKPKAAHSSSDIAAAPTTPDVAEKRGRGRPKGSHNKPKDNSDADSCTSEQAQPVPPAGLEAVSEKRGRGRPKGSHNKASAPVA